MSVEDCPIVRPQFYECGCCTKYHPKGWSGDCRWTEQSFFAEGLDKLYGVNGWEECEWDAGWGPQRTTLGQRKEQR